MWVYLSTTLAAKKGLPVLLGFLIILVGNSHGEQRRSISLGGQWEIAQGGMENIPQEFTAKVVVPGMVDLAVPAFEEVGVASEMRTAFWYRKAFKLDGPLPEVALLKIHKAKFGATVFVNGKEIGEHLPCFTPGYFDVSDALRGNAEENVVVVRIGATEKQLPDYVPFGFDFEKNKYIPGIFDRVELILTSNPRVENIQTIPSPEKQEVGLQVEIVNNGKKAQTFKPRYMVTEKTSGKVVAQLKGRKTSVGPREKRVLNETLKMENPKLWTPETPFLYKVTVDTGSDNLTQVFGMRSFRFDPETGFALLNGKRRYLKGTNICAYRFFEDPRRGDLVWDREWVRKLHRTIRDLGWDCVRYTIGLPPEFWYEIADEEGVMIMDEYPFWYFEKCPESITSKQIAIEYGEWMRERWNHPSVIVWDACNESSSPKTGEAARKVRHLDLSGRPWDDSTNPVMEKGDAFESHPYLFINPNFKISELPYRTTFPESPHNPKKYFDPPSIIINEYPWLWLDREGNPTLLTKRQWANLVGEDATPEQRRKAYGYYYAVLTEYWRSYRQAAAVQHFTILTYSRIGGYTSDHFTDIDNLVLEPHFAEATKRCFAPVGVMIENWEEEVSLEELRDRRKIPVVILNDLDENLTGQVRLSLKRDNETLLAKMQDVSIEAFGRGVVDIEFTHPSTPGEYRLEAEVIGMNLDTRSGKSIRIYNVVAKKEKNMHGVAVGKAARASSYQDESLRPELAVDGLLSTRWSSVFADPQWLVVDLGRDYKVEKVEIVWEPAFGKAYTIEVSADGKNYAAVYSTRSGDGGTDVIEFPEPLNAKWVRMSGTQRGTRWGYSIYEFKVFGDPVSDHVELPATGEK